MFVALDKLHRQNLKQAIVVVPEKSIGASFANTLLAKNGFFADWTVAPNWNLCNAPGTDSGKVDALGRFLASEDRLLVCTHATFRFAFEKFGVEAFDDRLIAVDEFHHVSVSEDNRLGEYVRQLIERDKTHLIAMTGSYFRGSMRQRFCCLRMNGDSSLSRTHIPSSQVVTIDRLERQETLAMSVQATRRFLTEIQPNVYIG